MGRPSALWDKQRAEVLKHQSEGVGVAAIAKQYSTSRQTIVRIRAAS